MIKKFFHIIRKALLTILVFIYLVFDELIWERVAEPIYEYIYSLKLLQKIQQYLYDLNRYYILTLFLMLFVGVELLSVIAIGLFAQGQALLAIIIYAAKIPIAAFTFWVFRITQNKLLTFAWFKWCYEGFQTLLIKLKTSQIYLDIKTQLHALKVWLKHLFWSAKMSKLRSIFGINSQNKG